MIDPPQVTSAGRGGLLASYLKAQFGVRCPPGWRCTTERPLLDASDRQLLGYDPRADVLLERTDGTRRLWIEFEISRADPAANHAKFATAHVLHPWTPSDVFVSMISAHVVRGRRNLGAGMIHVLRQVGINAFQTLLLPDLDRDGIKLLNHDRQALQAAQPDITPEIERALAVAAPVAVTSQGRLHFAADVFDVLLNLRRWNEEADDPARASLWRRRAVRYVVVDPISGWCAPAKFAAYIVLQADDAPRAATAGVTSALTFERYRQLDHAEPLFDGHRAWTFLTQRLRFTRESYGASGATSSTFDAWIAGKEHLLQIDRERLVLLLPPPSFR
jgi:hypothetical protein